VKSAGGSPFENQIVDFTEVPCVRECKYLLVLVCPFSLWMEAFPTQTEKAHEVSRNVKRNQQLI
jgi:hypothetical protein